MLMGRPRSRVSLNIEIDGKRLERVYESKILGVIIDHDLRFEFHINKLCKTTSSRISFLTRLKHFVPKHSLKTIFNALMQPHLDYGNIVWGLTFDIHTNRLESLQRKAAKVLVGFQKSSNEAFSLLDWIPISSRVKYNSVIYIFKALNNLVSNFATNFFEFSNTRYMCAIN